MRRAHTCYMAAVFVLALPALLAAQVSLTLPSTSQTTAASAVVSEQARITIPAGITFGVTNVSVLTTASAAAVTVSNVVLATSTKQLKLSVLANASSFTPPVVAATTWSAANVTWTAGSWTNATASAQTLSSAAYRTVATCTAGVVSCSTTGLVLRLAAKTTVKRSGAHTLVVRWKVESIGT